MESFIHLAYASLKASITLLQQVVDCLNFALYSKDLFFLVQMEKVTSMNYGSSTSNWKPWKQATENLHLIQYSWWGTCTSIPTWIHSQNSLAAAAELLSLNLSFHIISLKWSQRPSQSMQIVISPKIVSNSISTLGK